jgi:hypothetical protein
MLVAEPQKLSFQLTPLSNRRSFIANLEPQIGRLPFGPPQVALPASSPQVRDRASGRGDPDAVAVGHIAFEQ